MNTIEQQEEAARTKWRDHTAGRAALHEQMLQSRLFPAMLFKYCRSTLHWGLKEAVDPGGGLNGLISERRLRRCELGQRDIPDYLWQVLAQALEQRRVENEEINPEVAAHAQALLDLIKLVSPPDLGDLA